MTSRLNQYALMGLARDLDTSYSIMTNFADDGYDYYIAGILDPFGANDLGKVLGEDAQRFEKIVVPARKYLVCETERTQYPVELTEELRRKMISEWLPSSDYRLAEAPCARLPPNSITLPLPVARTILVALVVIRLLKFIV